MIRTNTVLALIATTLLACGKEPKNVEADPPPPTLRQVISSSATAFAVEERVLQTVAFVQSNFGQGNLVLPEVKRTLPLGLLEVETTQAGKTLDENIKFVAAEIAKRLKTAKLATDPFEQLRAAAEVVVGTLDDIKAEDLSTGMLLDELLRAYNSGFVCINAQGDTFSVPRLETSKQIDIFNLKRGQQYYLSEFLTEESHIMRSPRLTGNSAAEISDRTDNVSPKVVLRWCPANAVQCLDHLRKTATTSAHFLAFKGRGGERKFINLHPVSKDLAWNDKVLSNTISIAIAAHAGDNSRNWRPDVFDWGDYASLATAVRGPFQLGKDPTTPDNVIELLSSIDSTTPAGQTDFSLPVFWDSQVFREFLKIENSGTNQVSIDSPQSGGRLPDNAISVVFAPGLSAETVEISEDRADAIPGNPWRLTLTTGYDRTEDSRFSTTLILKRQGANKDQTRALRIISRDRTDRLIGYQIVRFFVPNLKASESKK